MLKKDLKEFDINAFKDFEESFAIVTAGNRTTGPNGMTVSWGGFGRIWEKFVCFVFVRKSRYTHEFMEKTDSVSISFLSDNYKKEKIFFGRNSGRDCDKFKETGLHAGFDPDLNMYIISEARRVLKCKKIYSIDLEFNDLPEEIKKMNYKDGDIHTMYICEVKEYLTDEE